MFADSILETSWAHRGSPELDNTNFVRTAGSGNRVAAVVALWRTVGLPTARVVSTPISVGSSAPEPAPQPRTGSASAPQSIVHPGRIMQPVTCSKLRSQKETTNRHLSPPIGDDGTGADVGNLPVGVGRPASLEHQRKSSRCPPIRPVTTVRQFRTSKLLEGKSDSPVAPAYPPLARSARIQGSVVVFALISKAGTIENLRVLSGHPMLVLRRSRPVASGVTVPTF